MSYFSPHWLELFDSIQLNFDMRQLQIKIVLLCLNYFGQNYSVDRKAFLILGSKRQVHCTLIYRESK
jgi:hypothetical protein